MLTLIFAIAVTIRLYQLSFFEYHYDQYFAIVLGNQARAAHFMITHGMCSGIGLDNPPVFSYMMGVFTAFLDDPARLTFVFFCMNILALAIAIVYFYRTLEAPYAILSTAFLALFPAFTIYSNNIWAQCSLPLIMILFNISLYRFIKYELWRNFFYMGLLATIAAQIHGAGFMLYPLLVIIAVAYWKKMDKRVILWAILATVILFIPYLVHLFGEHELSKVTAYGVSGKRTFQWKILPYHFRMASFDFFRAYFKFDLKEILKIIAGKWGSILYLLTIIPGILFIAGFVEYVRWLIKGKIFDRSEAACPLPFQISGIMLVIVTIGFMVFRIPTSLHYCIVLFPAYSILTGYAAVKLWRFYWARFIIVLGILATLTLLLGILVFVDRAGGHPYEYGVSYKSLIAWQEKIQTMKQRGECFDLKVRMMSTKDITDVPAMLSVLNKNNVCQAGDRIVPAQMDIGWNDKRKRYETNIILQRSGKM